MSPSMISTDEGDCGTYAYVLECAFGTPPLTWTSGCFGGNVYDATASANPPIVRVQWDDSMLGDEETYVFLAVKLGVSSTSYPQIP